jgi:hypothetical protein
MAQTIQEQGEVLNIPPPHNIYKTSDIRYMTPDNSCTSTGIEYMPLDNSDTSSGIEYVLATIQ